MDDFKNSFKRCKIEELSGQTANMTSSDAESISLTTSLTTRTTTKLITMLTDAIKNDRNDAKSISLTTTPTTNPITVLTDGMDNGRKDAETISLTTTQTTILTHTEKLVLGTNMYTTSTLTSSPNNNKQNEYGESSPTATMITNENELKCENISRILK